jgi:hypothetical protein
MVHCVYMMLLAIALCDNQRRRTDLGSEELLGHLPVRQRGIFRFREEENALSEPDPRDVVSEGKGTSKRGSLLVRGRKRKVARP